MPWNAPATPANAIICGPASGLMTATRAIDSAARPMTIAIGMPESVPIKVGREIRRLMPLCVMAPPSC